VLSQLGSPMARFLVRNLDDVVKAKLQRRARMA